MTSGFDAIVCRQALVPDADDIAALHTDSWRRNYRGAYSDAYLDGDVLADRRSMWTDRLTHHAENEHTIVAEADGTIVAFVHTILDEDPKWGALLDNLHTRHDAQRHGIGTRLMIEAAQVVIASPSPTGIYLWVLEQNTRAQGFYAGRGGTCVERRLALPPGGDRSRLSGAPAKLRYAWPDPAQLLQHS